jgi:iron complex transport system ATP-binding protein
MISLNQVSVIRHSKKILDNISLDFPKGKMIGLIGPNGAGKSTMMRLISGVIKQTKGKILYQGKKPGTLSHKERACTIGYLPQKAEISWPLSAQRVIALGRLPYQSTFSQWQPKDARAVEDAIIHSDCEKLRHQNILTLSGGELTRVLLARVLAGEPECIIADEPIAALDPFHQLQVLEILKDKALEGKTVIISLHDLNLAYRFCDVLALLDEGQLKAYGDPQHVLTLEHIQSIYQVNMCWLNNESFKALFPISRVI